jgi:hypothetical protein
VKTKAALGAGMLCLAAVLPAAVAQGASTASSTSSSPPLSQPLAGAAPSPSASSATTPPTAEATAKLSMKPPSGYTSQQLIFDDQFAGTTLNQSNWNTYLGAEGVQWNDEGVLPSPYSAPNDKAHGGNGFDLAMYGPSQVTVDNGLTLTAQPNTNQWASTYPWISGVVTTEGKFTLPTTGWYVQVKAKMPNMTNGMWPSIWFMPSVSGTSENELDGYEGGFSFYGPPNQALHSTYFLNSGTSLANTVKVSAGLAAGFNIYGIQWIPGVSVTVYLNGTQIWQVTEAQAGTIPAEPYEILLDLAVASTTTRYWHTYTTSSTPTSSMQVAEVQAYS